MFVLLLMLLLWLFLFIQLFGCRFLSRKVTLFGKVTELMSDSSVSLPSLFPARCLGADLPYQGYFLFACSFGLGSIRHSRYRELYGAWLGFPSSAALMSLVIFPLRVRLLGLSVVRLDPPYNNTLGTCARHHVLLHLLWFVPP